MFQFLYNRTVFSYFQVSQKGLGILGGVKDEKRQKLKLGFKVDYTLYI